MAYIDRRNLCKTLFSAGLGLTAQSSAFASHPTLETAGNDPLALTAAESETDTLDLVIAETPVSFDGRKAMAMTINGTVPGPVIRLREHRHAVLRVTNKLKETTSIHWHGLIVPHDMDGVPGVSYPGIRPGETFTYRFLVRQSGTYWCHSHSGGQEMLGIYAPLVIEPAQPEPFSYDRDHIVMLSDWSFDSPEHVLDHLKVQSNYYNFHRRTAGDFFSDVSGHGFRAATNERAAWARMRMDPTDLADTSGYAYRFLMNGRTPKANWSALFRPGEKIRLRFINAGTMTFYDVRIPGLSMTVVSADGQLVQPVTVEEFRMGPAETYDVIVTPAEDRAFTIFAETMDRTGYARGTLAPRAGMAGALPERRKSPVRSMDDMGMEMSEMSGMSMPGMNHKSGMNMPGMDKGKLPAAPKQSSEDQMQDMPGMKHRQEGKEKDMAGMHHPSAKSDMPGMTHPSDAQGMGDMPGMKTPGPMNMPMDGMQTVKGSDGKNGATGPSLPDGPPLQHGPDHHGPANSAVPMQINNRLAEPGVGLGKDGWRVLVYSDLKALKPYPDRRSPGREVELHITGNMDRYMWSFDGKKYSDAKEPIQFEYGERLRLSLVNDTMMEHPIHLHGMWMELENGAGDYQPRKHTISVKPAERVTLAITADAPGHWVMHCHLLLHMEMGMFRVINVIGGMQYMNEPGRLSTQVHASDIGIPDKQGGA